MNNEMHLPRISFKGVSVFLLILAAGLFILVKPLLILGFTKDLSLYIATSLSAAAGMSLVLLYVDDKVNEKRARAKRIALSLVVSFALSYVLVYIVQ